MAAPTFRIGSKELFLPKFTVAFLRTPGLPAQFARFRVPLWFSKLDLRDYLWHAYAVDVLGVRSSVKQSRVQQGKDGQPRPTPRRWHRPPARKFMTVELVRPFVWPAEPDSYAEWNQRERQESETYSDEFAKGLSATADTVVPTDRRTAMREQARALLEGREQWKPSAYRMSTAEALRRRS